MYTTTDLAELIRHHLVFAEPDTERSAHNLRKLVLAIEQMAPRRLLTAAEWLFCDGCGCAVDTEVLAWDGSNWTSDGGFYCSDCIPGASGDFEC
jgi:hypothetical protein